MFRGAATVTLAGMTEAIIAHLRGVPALATLTEDHLAEIARHATETRVNVGDVLVREGSTDRRTLIVVAGAAHVFVDGLPVGAVGPGAVVGELGMLESQPRACTIRASTDMRLLVLDGGGVGVPGVVTTHQPISVHAARGEEVSR
jgi:hypothetical protein